MTPHLETFSQWIQASRPDRAGELPACLKRIQTLEPTLQAWAQIEPQPPTGDGPLAKIPFGVKEIIETKGLLTEYGSPLYRGRIGTEDAAIVRLLREQGGLLLGKTVSTAFAYFTPGPTRNPRNPLHTPGGSSSGSAAAVAAGMVPVAIGTQTAGSVLRPASFCGVTGFKATFDLLPMAGVLPCSKSLDTLGFFTHTADDMAAFWEALGHSVGYKEDFVLATPSAPPEVDPPMAKSFQASLLKLRQVGVVVRPIDIADLLTSLRVAQRTVMFYEGARFHEERYREFGDRLEHLAVLVREGLQISVPQYDEAQRHIAASRVKFTEIYKATPVILVPAAVGPAPLGLSSTGDPRMNAPWTALGTPAISIPMPAAEGLPLGLQLTADVGQDARVIRTATWVERLLNQK